MKELKMAASLFTLLLLWSASSILVSASSVWTVVGLSEPDKVTSSPRLGSAELLASDRVDPVRHRPCVKRLPPLPRWYPPPLSGRKSRPQKGKGKQGCRRSKKQKKRCLSAKQSQNTGQATLVALPKVTGSAELNATPPLPLSGENSVKLSEVIVNEDMELAVNTSLPTIQASQSPSLSPAPVAATLESLAVEESQDTSPDSLSSVIFPDPEIDQEWARQQWTSVELGDKRRTRRAVLMGERMVLNPGGSIPEQMGSWGATKAAYRLLNEKDVTLNGLSQPHWEQSRQEAADEGVVLMIQDTTEMDFTAQSHIKNLGPIGDGRGRGFLLHSVLAFAPDVAKVLGLAHQQSVLRIPRVEGERKKKWTHSPESLLWEKATRSVGKPPADAIWVQTGDRGSDSFGFMAACDPKNNLHFLFRLKSNRVLDWSERAEPAPMVGDPERYLISYARTLSAQGQTFTVDVAPRKGQPRRTATVQLAWSPVTIPAPKEAPKELRQHQPIKAWVVRVWEVNPPPKVEAVEWVLLSSLPVLSWDDAHQRSQWYAKRWLIEDFHKVLKTGCRIEHTQLDDRLDIERLLGFLSPIAVRLLQLRQIARQVPDTLARTEIGSLPLHLLASELQCNPTTMTIAQFWAGVAQLGGHLGRKGDGTPGWITLWRGYRQLQLMVRGARLILDSGQGAIPLLKPP